MITQHEPRHVVVVGGGLSGLTTAYLLLRDGKGRFRVTVLESEEVPGGQARAFKLGGHTVEHGSHAFFGYYKNSVALLEELGTRGDVAEVRGWTIVDAYGRQATLVQSEGLPILAAAPSIMRVPWFRLSDKLRALIGAYRLATMPYERFGELDKMTSWELGAEVGYTPLGTWTWNAASLGLTNLFVNEQSGAIFAGKHKVLVGSERGLDYLLPSMHLGRLLAQPLAERIRALGGTLLLGTHAKKIDRTVHEAPGVAALGPSTTRLRVEHSQGSLDADHVVVALQPKDAVHILPGRSEPWTTLRPTTPVITMTLQLSGRVAASQGVREYGFSREHWAFSVLTDLSLFWPEYKGEKTVLRVELGHADRLPGGVNTDEKELIPIVKRDLARFWPEVAGLSVDWYQMHKETRHLYVAWTRGEFVKRPTPAQRDLGGGIFLAGDWTSKGTIGMEAAVNSAYEAASHVRVENGLAPLEIEDVPL